MAHMFDPGETPMNSYRCCLLGREGDVRATEDIDAPSREDAVALARAILGHRRHHAGFELWLDAKCVHIETAAGRAALSRAIPGYLS
jgi:hypothetical protein